MINEVRKLQENPLLGEYRVHAVMYGHQRELGDLWQLTDAEWLLALRRPEQGKRKKRHTLLVAVQLTFPDFAISG